MRIAGGGEVALCGPARRAPDRHHRAGGRGSRSVRRQDQLPPPALQPDLNPCSTTPSSSNWPPSSIGRSSTRVPLEHFSKRLPRHDDRRRLSHRTRLGGAADRQREESVIGHKIGLTSRAMQLSSQIDEPDFGTLLDSMRFTAQCRSTCWKFPRSRASSRRVSRWNSPSCSRRH